MCQRTDEKTKSGQHSALCIQYTNLRELSQSHLRFLIFETSSHTFFNDRKSIFQNVKMCEMMKKSEIYQNVLQKSMTEKNDFLIFGRVKSFVGSSPSFSTPNFLSGTPEKCFNFMIALDHNCIFSDHQKNLKINL